MHWSWGLWMCAAFLFIYIVQGNNFFFSNLFNLHFLDSNQSMNKQGILLKRDHFPNFSSMCRNNNVLPDLITHHTINGSGDLVMVPPRRWTFFHHNIIPSEETQTLASYFSFCSLQRSNLQKSFCLYLIVTRHYTHII